MSALPAQTRPTARPAIERTPRLRPAPDVAAGALFGAAWSLSVLCAVEVFRRAPPPPQQPQFEGETA